MTIIKAALTGAVMATTVLAVTPDADAVPANCESVPWGFLGSQTRQICDGRSGRTGHGRATGSLASQRIT
jgi:hypothetical protein